MKCQALINDFLMDYYSGTLSVARRVDFELHLIVCVACRRYVDSYKKTIQLAKNAVSEEEADVPPELVKAILEVCSRVEP